MVHVDDNGDVRNNTGSSNSLSYFTDQSWRTIAAHVGFFLRFLDAQNAQISFKNHTSLIVERLSTKIVHFLKKA